MSAGMTESQRVSRLVTKLERWIEKRQAKHLDSQELYEAVAFLRDYTTVLAASEALHEINTFIRNGGGDNAPSSSK